MKSILALSITALASGLAARDSRPIQSGPRSFVLMQDNKVGGGETFTRGADSIVGDIALGNERVHYAGRIAPDGTIPRLDIRAARSRDVANTARLISITVGRDDVDIVEHVRGKVDTLRLASKPGTVPIFDPSIGLYELIATKARSQKLRTVAVPIVKIDADALGASPNASLRSIASFVPGVVTLMSSDTVMLGNAQQRDKVRIVLGSDGRVRDVMNGADAKDRFSAHPVSGHKPN